MTDVTRQLSCTKQQFLWLCMLVPPFLIAANRLQGKVARVHQHHNMYKGSGDKEPDFLNIFVIPFHLQSVQVHSANCVKIYTVACRRVLSSALLQQIDTMPVVACRKET
jgi:hypothetical protein